MKKASLKFKFKQNRTTFIVAFLLFIFPLVIGGIYALPLPQIIAVEVGDLLAYYGVVFGIFGSFITYRKEKKNKEKERNKELRPAFSIDVKRDESANVFVIDIVKLSEPTLTYMNLYDEFISDIVEKSYSLKVTYGLSVEDTARIHPDYNFTSDDEILDNDGYPKYIQIICDDVDGNCWSCCYYKIKNGNMHFYYPRDIEIL